MTKIAIISQPEHGVIVDVEGCASAAEATQHLTSALPVSSQFWEGMEVDLKLGRLGLTPQELNQILSTVKEAGISPRHILTSNNFTKQALAELHFSAVPPRYSAPSLVVASKQPDGGTGKEAATSTTAVALQEPLEFFHQRHPSATGAVSTEPESQKLLEQEFLPATEKIAEKVENKENGSTEPLTSNRTIDSSPPPADSTDPATAAAGNREEAAADAAPVSVKATKEEKVPQVLLLKQTLRAGQAVSHRGHLVIIGDVNPGAEVIAEGDITVWGALRGMAHAGAGNNTKAEIRALKLQAIQLRIAHAIARAPDQKKVGLSAHSGPEVARIVEGKIRISSGDPE